MSNSKNEFSVSCDSDPKAMRLILKGDGILCAKMIAAAMQEKVDIIPVVISAVAGFAVENPRLPIIEMLQEHIKLHSKNKL